MDLPLLSEGSHTLKVVMYSNAIANRGGPYTAIVYFTVETTGGLAPPTISNLSIAETTYNVTELPPQFITNKNDVLTTYSLDGQANVTVNGNTTLTSLTDGMHRLTLYVQDDWGNTGSQAVVFTIQTPKPAPTQTPNQFPTALFAVGSVAVAAVVAVTAVVYFKKRKRG
jgi:hypothetical protein